ncbi:MAG TPA: hypothetical protein VGQ36_22140 [Thermoanaerobaculia bacterium]|jgi:hypothetical protein|nr:hypothetical protein [Thermoanaerobaculia bacterium]
MAIFFALLLTITAPKTDWMRLEAFHLAIGMPRTDALAALSAWNPKPGKDANEIVVDYAADKSLTLEFKKERLHSVRFELFVLLPHVRKAFEEKRAAMGKPRMATRSVLVYDNALPNVMVVVADDPKSEQGKKGLGVLAVRYYDPR